MIKQLATLSIVAMIFGAAQMPANAYEYWHHYDHNHDGRWDRAEFHNANSYYWNHHPHNGIIINRGYNDREFGRLDINHDGYLGANEYRHYHHW